MRSSSPCSLGTGTALSIFQGWFRPSGRDDADPSHTLGLLRARRERPGSRRAPEQRDELAAVQSITSSARASSVGGISTPIVLAAFKLMINSNLVGCSTGKSTGFAPLKTLSR